MPILTTGIRGIRVRGAATLSVLTVAAAATALTATAIPAQAAADPEAAAIQAARGSGAVSTGILDTPTLRALISSADANARISAKLPLRGVSSAIGSNYSVNVVDIASGETVYARNNTKPMLSASNMKVVTAVNALTVLGPDTRQITKVQLVGKGKVAIVGAGDTMLNGKAVQALARKTQKALKAHPEWLPATRPAHMGIPATCVRKGKVVSSTAAKPCKKVMIPAGPGPLKIFIDDSLYAAPSVPAGWRSGYEPYVVRPVRPLGFDGDYSWDSGRNVASYMSSYLAGRGTPAKVKGRTKVSSSSPLLGSRKSQTVATQVKYMLQVSENNVAEMLFRNVAAVKGYSTDWAGAKKAATDQLAAMGIPTEGLSLDSGSGVSRDDRLTTLALTELLKHVADKAAHPELDAVYYGGGMPLAGYSGTLSAGTGRFVTSPTNCARGLIRAKTGTLFDTIGLSGLTVGTDGNLKAFSILVNSRPQGVSPLTTRKAVDKLAATVNGCY